MRLETDILEALLILRLRAGNTCHKFIKHNSVGKCSIFSSSSSYSFSSLSRSASQMRENSLLWCFSEIDFTSLSKEPVIPLMLLNFFLSQSVKVHVEQWTGHDRSLDAKLPQRLRLYECVRVHPVKLLLQNACPPPSLSNPLLSCLTGIKKKLTGTNTKRKLMKN